MAEVVAGQMEPERLDLRLDNLDVDDFCRLAPTFGTDRYGYVVTPNVDHIIMNFENPAFHDAYENASFTVLDSQFLAHLLRVSRGLKLKVCAGSDLTRRMFETVIRPEDRVVVFGSTAPQVQQLRERFGLKDLVHIDPPMGFIKRPEQVEEALRALEAASPFRYCFFAVGSPQGELTASMLKKRGVARGLGMSIGAAVDFMTGQQDRAPLWMRRAGLEWMYRLLTQPKRLGKRYLVRGPRVFKLLRRVDLESRDPAV